jgi:hypothetical protein
MFFTDSIRHLEHYFARHVSTHSFTQSVLRSAQRGELMRWARAAQPRFRYYDPQVGYVNQDPIGLMGGENVHDPRSPAVRCANTVGLRAMNRRAQVSCSKCSFGSP